MKNKMFLQMRPDLKEVDRISSDIYDELVPIVGREKAFIVELVVIEACTNIVKHGCIKEDSQIDIELSINQRNIEFTITDEGTPFNPLLKKLPDLSNLEELKNGGIGIYLIRNLSKRISYKYSEGKNRLKILL